MGISSRTVFLLFSFHFWFLSVTVIDEVPFLNPQPFPYFCSYSKMFLVVFQFSIIFCFIVPILVPVSTPGSLIRVSVPVYLLVHVPRFFLFLGFFPVLSMFLFLFLSCPIPTLSWFCSCPCS